MKIGQTLRVTKRNEGKNTNITRIKNREARIYALDNKITVAYINKGQDIFRESFNYVDILTESVIIQVWEGEKWRKLLRRILDMNNTIKRIRKYRELKADIKEIEIRLQELDEEILGVSAQGTGERTGKTYKITSSVEQQAEKLMEKKEELIREKAVKQREVERIDNAMTVLLDEEREIIQVAHIEHKKYWRLEQKLNLTYSRIKQIEHDAIDKMKKYIA